MKKYILSGEMAILATIVLAGCGSNNSSTDAVNKEVVTESIVETNEKEITYTYGTATLTYSEFYAGDVSSVDSFDAVSSATKSKYEIMGNMSTDFVDETANAEGYHILGVKNVSLAVDVDDLEEYKKINPTFVESGNIPPTQYKVVEVEDGRVTYSGTVMNVVDTIKDAKAELLTDTNWGDYQINVIDGEKVYLRNTREDEGFAINSNIQGVILETESGLKVGMEYLQSIWVQPYEVSFNVLSNNTHNTHITQFDNLDELSKLVGETVVKITYIMPTETYVYEFEGIYIKPAYDGIITSVITDDTLKLSTSDFSMFSNARIAVEYTIGSGRDATRYTLYSGNIDGDVYKLDLSEILTLEDKSGLYSAIISSDNYADIAVPIPASEEQFKSLETLIKSAEEAFALDTSNETLEEHIEEAKGLLNGEATSSEIASITNELSRLISSGNEDTAGKEKSDGAR